MKELFTLILAFLLASAPENSFHVVTLAADENLVDVFLKSVSETLRVVGIQRK